MRTETRKQLLARAGRLLFGVSAGLAGGASLAHARSSAPFSGVNVGLVTGVREGSVQVDGALEWIPIDGFPDGWTPALGDRMLIGTALAEPSRSTVAYPLVEAVPVEVSPAGLRPGARLRTEPSGEIVASTIVSPDLASGRSRHDTVMRRCVAWLIDRGPHARGTRVIALRGEGAR